jgi:hypothetical protein
VPRPYAPRTRVSRLTGATGGTPFWVSRTRRCLRSIGDVTGGLKQRGRHVGPTKTTSLVTDLAEGMLRPVVGTAHRRGPVEQSPRARKPPRGLDEHHVRTEVGRIEKSLGIAVLW